ncbi:glycosyltransferase [Candidatus Pelagibacter bacterium]|jgi:N-acetylglucosaminyl-diphospho-decaprenol L-rhamnosyltransferase|nr:glycosyltransferase [Candidatus Pelagibacter bacterium]
MESKDISIVIVTFKSEDIISKCLKSIPNDIKVIIVENSKNEKFKKNLENKYNNVDCILTGNNRGYAAANNIGLNIVKTKYALVLNPDCILEHEAIRNFFITANKVQDFHLIGPAQGQMINIDFKNNDFIEVENLKGFAIFFNMSKFSNKFFDENYFLYFEEIDLCKYVKKNNGKIYLDKNIVIKHEGGSSVKKLNKIELEKNRNWHWMWSTFYFHKKHKGFLLALVIILPKLLSSFFKLFIFMLILNKEKHSIYVCRLSGIFNSIIGKKSWYRPSID